MKNFICLVLGVSCSLLIAGCNQTTSAESSDHLNGENSKIQALENRVESLESAKSISDLLKSFESVAFMKLGSDGYSIIKIDMGHLTVSIDDVKPYANGSKVKISFGNTTSATLTGLKATIDWGSLNEDGVPNNEKAKSKEVQFVESLRPGAWTPVFIVLEGVPPQELGFVRFHDVGHSGIELRTYR